MLIKWLLGLTADYEKSSNPVLRLLTTVLAHDGDLQGEDNIRLDMFHLYGNLHIVCISIPHTFSAPDRSRLRLVAACGLLKLAQCHHYKELIAPDQFVRLALTMQVELT